jgi:hypothetical protein
VSISKSEIKGPGEWTIDTFFSDYDRNHDYRTGSSILSISQIRSKNENENIGVLFYSGNIYD